MVIDTLVPSSLRKPFMNPKVALLCRNDLFLDLRQTNRRFLENLVGLLSHALMLCHYCQLIGLKLSQESCTPRHMLA